MQFSWSCTEEPDLVIHILDGFQIERVSSNKYLSILIDEKLTFKLHVDDLARQLRMKLGFLYDKRTFLQGQ